MRQLQVERTHKDHVTYDTAVCDEYLQYNCTVKLYSTPFTENTIVAHNSIIADNCIIADVIIADLMP